MKKIIKYLMLRHKAKKFSKATGCLGVVCLGDGNIVSETEYWRITNTELRESYAPWKPENIIEFDFDNAGIVSEVTINQEYLDWLQRKH